MLPLSLVMALSQRNNYMTLELFEDWGSVRTGLRLYENCSYTRLRLYERMRGLRLYELIRRVTLYNELRSRAAQI